MSDADWIGRFLSYINNLHPKHRDLYELTEEIIAKSIPLWDQTLLAAISANDTKNRLDWDIKYDFDEEDVPPGTFDPEDDEDTQWEKTEEWKTEMRQSTVVLPDAGDYVPFLERAKPYEEEDKGVLEVNLIDEFAEEKGLQVIVKLASIYLTPEKPKYPGGSWHIEGQLVSTYLGLEV